MKGVAFRPRSARLLVAASLLGGVAGGGLAGCGPAGAGLAERAAARPPLDGAAWREARHSVAVLRDRFAPGRPRTMNVTVEMTHPLSGQRLRARGAVAVSPEQEALRMILLGPGGTTALDLWVCGDRYRFVLPSVGLRLRGDGADAAGQARGLPVEFLRWWLLRPLGGRLLYASVDAEGRRYLLRDGDDVVDARVAADGSLTLERRGRADRHGVSTTGPGCATVRYRQQSTGVAMTIACERIDASRPPRPAAFVDPDDPSQACPAPPGELR